MPHSVSYDKIVGMWTVPYSGVTRDVSIYEVPSDALWDSLNMVPRRGQFVPRPGPQQYAPDDLLATPTGSIWSPVTFGPAFQASAFQNNAFQTRRVDALLIAATQQAIWYLDPTTMTWVNIMPVAGNVFQGDAFQADMVQGAAKRRLTSHTIGRFAQLEGGTPATIFTVFANGQDESLVWDMSKPLVETPFDNKPRWSDVISVADRFVGITPPYDVSWTEDLSSPAGIFSIPELNRKSLGESPDPVVAIRRSGYLAFTVYKKRSIHTAVATGGTSAQAFRFSYRGDFEGPASPAAVVSINGMDIRMTRTGRIGFWNGQVNEWALDNVWWAVEEGTTFLPALDQAYAHRIFGVYHEDFNEVWFHYPQVGDNGLLYGLLIVNLPSPNDPQEVLGGFPGRMRIAVSAGCDRAATDALTLLFRERDGQNVAMLVHDSPRDMNMGINLGWQPGLTPAPGGEVYRMQGHESFLERNAAYGTLDVQVMFSNHLADPDGEPGTAVTVDLTRIPLPKEEKGGDVRARFFGLRYTGNTETVFPKWMGARLAATLVELAPGKVGR